MTRVVYVAGTGYSGSTLLSFLANGHPQMATVGEPTGPIETVEDPETYPCSCGEPVSACPFWREVSSVMTGRGHRFDARHWDLRFEFVRGRLPRQLLRQSLRSNALDDLRDTAVLAVPAWRRRLGDVAGRYRAFVESVLEVTGRRVFFDATKDPTQARYLLRLLDLDVRVVHLVRDAPGFVSSWIKNRGEDVEPGVRQWNRTASHVERLAARLPAERFLRLRYEDLCTRTEGELARLARFAGLEPASGPVNFRAGGHHVIGNRMRLASSSEVRLDETWRTRLTPAQIDAVLRRTAFRRRRLGYA